MLGEGCGYRPGLRWRRHAALRNRLPSPACRLRRRAPHLPQLDVVELRVGMDVCICDADERAACGSLGWSMLHGLQHRNQRHIVLRASRAAAGTPAGDWLRGHAVSSSVNFRAVPRPTLPNQ
eukprot:354857-Chlamydomonas_euryale.AAC.7